MSYFRKLASKKVEGGEKCEGVENGANTKKDKRKAISVERDAEDSSKKLRSAENEKFTGNEKKNPMELSTEALIASGMENLAPEILITIFGLLPFGDLKRAMLVCRFVILKFSLKDRSKYASTWNLA